MKTLSLVLVLLVAVSTVAGTYLLAHYLKVFEIHGIVNVERVNETKYTTIEVTVNITEPEGSKVLRNIAILNIGNTSRIQFVVLKKEVEGDVKITLNGRAILESPSGKYKISMPCLLSEGYACYRIQTVIPGYDIPLEVEPGTYNVTLILSWRAEGKGTFHLLIAVTQ